MPLKVNVNFTEFAPSLTRMSNTTQSTPALTPPHSEDVAKENVHRNLEEQKVFFPIDASVNRWDKCCLQKARLKADRVYLISAGRDALIMQGCLLALGDVPFSRRSTQALPGPGDVTMCDFPPTTPLAARRPPPCRHTSRWAAPVLPNTLLCFWMLGTQAAGRIH